MKKPIYEKKRPKSLGKPKSFDKSSDEYKKAKAMADRRFGSKVSLYKNIFISKKIKELKRKK